jgi:hypothetical protein
VPAFLTTEACHDAEGGEEEADDVFTLTTLAGWAAGFGSATKVDSGGYSTSLERCCSV